MAVAMQRGEDRDDGTLAGADDVSAHALPAHALSVKETLDRLRSGLEGLERAEAGARRALHGPNRLPEPPAAPWPRRIGHPFRNLMVVVLLLAAAVSALGGYGLDATMILAAAMAGIGLGLVREGCAGHALDGTRRMLAPAADVIRGGVRCRIAAGDLVPGDIVVLGPGDRVPADLRLVTARGVRADESVLTGRAAPVGKTTDHLAPAAELAKRFNMLFSGTRVTAGHAVGVVTATGAGCEIARLARTGMDRTPATTPLLNQMDEFRMRQMAVVLALAALAFSLAVWVRGAGAHEGLMTAVALAVTASPEGLPAALSIALALGVQRMARRNALIHRLPAIETLGSVDVICTDKTGILTRNEPVVRSVRTADGLYRVEGEGYCPTGVIQAVDAAAGAEALAPVLLEAARAGLLCNDAALSEVAGRWIVEGSPLDGAMLAFAMKAGIDPATERREHRRAGHIPFEAGQRFMATLHRAEGGMMRIFVKGAPEQVLRMAARERGVAGDRAIERAKWESWAGELAAQGMRVLAVAVKPMPGSSVALEMAHVDAGLCMLGLVGLADPPRAGTRQALARCRRAGIAVKMITGDHAGTARAVGLALGLTHVDPVLTGRDIDRLDDEELRREVWKTGIFARAAPEHKLRIVEALRARGGVVAMTGDGVNDAPALARADIGVAMGIKGTHAAKEAARMVLADDGFASIARAAHAARGTCDNLRKAVIFLLPVSGAEAGTVLLALILGMALPILPVQLLWVHLVSSTPLALALAFEAAEPRIMRHPPRAQQESLLSAAMLWRVAFIATVFLSGTFAMFWWHRHLGHDVATARTAAINTLVALEVFYLFSVRYLHGRSLTWAGVRGTWPVLLTVGAVTLLQLAFTYLPAMNALFGTSPLGVPSLALVLAAGMAGFALAELEKRFNPARPGSPRHRASAAIMRR